MLREEGHKVGVLKLRVFRPFPEKEIAEAIKRSGCKAVAIMDRCESYNGCSGPLGSEIPAGFYRSKVMVDTVNYIYGLAGRDFTVDHVREIFAELEQVARGEKEAPNHKYIGLRE
jgi:pyruvate ferredoxin oxidoreductase alpha subunit